MDSARLGGELVRREGRKEEVAAPERREREAAATMTMTTTTPGERAAPSSMLGTEEGSRREDFPQGNLWMGQGRRRRGRRM